jgi:hypothetical protein
LEKYAQQLFSLWLALQIWRQPEFSWRGKLTLADTDEHEFFLAPSPVGLFLFARRAKLAARNETFR